MKIIVFIFIFLFLNMPCLAQTFDLNVQKEEAWTVESAKQEVFNGIVTQRDLNWANPSNPDPRYQINLKAIKEGKTRVENYIINAFYDNSLIFVGYAIQQDKSLNSFYYDADGNLIAVGYDTTPDKYPNKAYKYNYPEGDLISAVLNVGPANNYMYKPDGELDAHWINLKGFNADGQLVHFRANVNWQQLARLKSDHKNKKYRKK